MTDQEEINARGQLLTQYAETKRRLALLKAESARLGDILQRLGTTLAAAPELVYLGAEPPADVHDHRLVRMLEPPDLSTLRDLTIDIRATTKTLDVLTQRLKDLGVP